MTAEAVEEYLLSASLNMDEDKARELAKVIARKLDYSPMYEQIDLMVELDKEDSTALSKIFDGMGIHKDDLKPE